MADLVLLDEHGGPEHSGLERKLLLNVRVICDVAEFFFHLADGLEVGRVVGCVAAEQEQLRARYMINEDNYIRKP